MDLVGHPGQRPHLTDERLGCRHVVTPSSRELFLGCDYTMLASGSSGPPEQQRGCGRGFEPRCRRWSPVTQGPARPAAEGREARGGLWNPNRGGFRPRPVPLGIGFIALLLVLSSLVWKASYLQHCCENHWSTRSCGRNCTKILFVPLVLSCRLEADPSR